MSRNALPPKYRMHPKVDEAPESHGFRLGAFALSLLFLLVGLAMCLSAMPDRDVVPAAIGVAFMATFAISMVAGRRWSDRPL